MEVSLAHERSERLRTQGRNDLFRPKHPLIEWKHPTTLMEASRRSPTAAVADGASPRMAFKLNGRICFVQLGDALAVEAKGNSVLIRKEANSYSLRGSISAVERQLEPYGFIRIHRSVLVNKSFVQEIWARPTGEYGLQMKGGQEYTVTRTYKPNLKSIAELWIGSVTLFAD
jgi:DNA-binding LytR/AlgR family response regulator